MDAEPDVLSLGLSNQGIVVLRQHHMLAILELPDFILLSVKEQTWNIIIKTYCINKINYAIMAMELLKLQMMV